MKATSVFCACLLLLGCAGLLGTESRQGVSSSLVDYLYPSGEEPPAPPQNIPHLQLPVRVGLAFVPSGDRIDQALPESERIRLLNDVKAQFAGRDFIAAIEVIPESYLRSGRGFQTLEQTARLYNLDVIALVSYDQVSHTDERKSSFLYWTVVGAYVVKGNENEVHTFVDTAVFDVTTRKLLLRAPGVSDVGSSSTLVEVGRDLRAARQRGFEQAMTGMTGNLDKELDAFKERIRTEGTVRVTRSDGTSYGGGGAGGLASLALLALLAGLRRRVR